MRIILDGFLLLLQIILINLVLSGDNAVVIAMACKNLPHAQRTVAVWWGTIGAVVARVVLTIVAIQLLGIPYIQVIGGLFLIWIAARLMIDQDEHSSVKEATSMRDAITIVIIADVIMSLDNVLAIAAAGQGNVTLTIVGVALSIPMIVFGSQLIMNLLQRYPILLYLGAALLGYTAGEMLVHDEKVNQYFIDSYSYLDWLIPIVTTCLVVAYGPTVKFIKRFR